eukprot:GFYU01018487.1.p1 GENE.GFYU01018487.1~~GFYU01018487.1.p1  ORF type:complete len:194 (+),score=66.98 GFYU01018487.1:50-583(+)
MANLHQEVDKMKEKVMLEQAVVEAENSSLKAKIANLHTTVTLQAKGFEKGFKLFSEKELIQMADPDSKDHEVEENKKNLTQTIDQMKDFLTELETAAEDHTKLIDSFDDMMLDKQAVRATTAKVLLEEKKRRGLLWTTEKEVQTEERRKGSRKGSSASLTAEKGPPVNPQMQRLLRE